MHHYFDYDLDHEMEFAGALYRVSGTLHFAFTIRPPDRFVGLFHSTIDTIQFYGEQCLLMSPNGEDEGAFTHVVPVGRLTEDSILATIWDSIGETIMEDALESAEGEYSHPLHP